MKGFTDLDQSRKLKEILPIESADMYYFLDPTPAGNIYHLTVKRVDFGIKNFPQYGEGDIPCWSLAALMDVLPSNKNVVTTVSRGGWQTDPIDYLPNVWWCEYEDDESFTEFSISADNPVDACYEMIIKLHEQKLL